MGISLLTQPNSPAAVPSQLSGMDATITKPSNSKKERPSKRKRQSQKNPILPVDLIKTAKLDSKPIEENPVQDSGDEDVKSSEDVAPSHTLSSSQVTTYYVNNLPYDTTREEIMTHFASCGISECRLCIDKTTGTFKGAAFVVVRDSMKTSSLHLSKLNKRVINVRPQLSREELVKVAEEGQKKKQAQVNSKRRKNNLPKKKKVQ